LSSKKNEEKYRQSGADRKIDHYQSKAIGNIERPPRRNALHRQDEL